MAFEQEPLFLREFAVLICNQMGGLPVPTARGGGPVYTPEFKLTYNLLREARIQAEANNPDVQWNRVRLKEGIPYPEEQATLILEELAHSLEVEEAGGPRTDNRIKVRRPTSDIVRAVMAERLSTRR